MLTSTDSAQVYMFLSELRFVSQLSHQHSVDVPAYSDACSRPPGNMQAQYYSQSSIKPLF